MAKVGGKRRKITDKEVEAFLDRLRKCGSEHEAAESLGRTYRGFYDLRKKSPGFDESRKKAIKEYVALCDAELGRRGKEGWDKPQWYQGKVVGYNKMPDTPALIRYLEAHSEKYRKSKHRVELTGRDGKDLKETDPLEVARRVAYLLKIGNDLLERKHPIIDITAESSENQSKKEQLH